MAGVNSRFVEVTEDTILRMQDNAIPNNTEKATKLGMEVFTSKQCFTNTQFTHKTPVSSTLAAFLNPDCQAPLPMPLSLNNNCPSTAPFQSPIQVSSTSIEQNVSIQKTLNVAISKNDCDFQQQAHWDMISGVNFTNCSFNSISSKLQLPSRNYFKALIT